MYDWLIENNMISRKPTLDQNVFIISSVQRSILSEFLLITAIHRFSTSVTQLYCSMLTPGIAPTKQLLWITVYQTLSLVCVHFIGVYGHWNFCLKAVFKREYCSPCQTAGSFHKKGRAHTMTWVLSGPVCHINWIKNRVLSRVTSNGHKLRWLKSQAFNEFGNTSLGMWIRPFVGGGVNGLNMAPINEPNKRRKVILCKGAYSHSNIDRTYVVFTFILLLSFGPWQSYF